MIITPVPAGDLLAGYELHEVAAGLRPATVRARLGAARRLLAATGGAEPTPADCERVLAACRAPATRAAYRQHLRAFGAWCVEVGAWQADPAAALPRVRQPRGLPRPVPEAVLDRALMVAEPTARRVLILGAYAGLRIGEIAALHGADLDGEVLRIAGKGGHERRVPMHELVAAELGDLRGWAFQSPRGGHLGAQYLGVRARDTLGGGWTAHSLRHRFATRVYAATGDLRAVQELLGHASPATTARYVAVAGDRLAAVVAAI